MSGDYSRHSFDPRRDFSSVLLQQGRVSLDADWNELAAIAERRQRAEAVDVVGRCGVPRETPDGFRIEITGAPGSETMMIGRGRLYAQGLLAENHGDPPLTLDLHVPGPDGNVPAGVLAEPLGGDAVAYDQQPYYPGPPTLPTSDGPHLVYADVWQRERTAVEDDRLLEKALGGVDTTTRLQTVWQVRVLPDVGQDAGCATPPAGLGGWAAETAPSAGVLTTGVVEVEAPDDPCLLPPGGGYASLENQLYRVEIHDGGPPGSATFKWSRDNATVAAAVEEFPAADRLTVTRIGRDDVLRFHVDDWVEVSDDLRELHGRPGELRRVVDISEELRQVVLSSALPADLVPSGTGGDTAQARRSRIRRWDQRGEVRDAGGALLTDLDDDASGGVIPIPVDGTTLTLERNVTVTFGVRPSGGGFLPLDHWAFAARSADRSVEVLTDAPPRGIHHRYCRLALIGLRDGAMTVLDDCRPVFPALTGLTAADVGFDNDVCELPGAGTVQDALDLLCEEHTLRRHNKHLHGWGIVCGLQVVCGPDGQGQPRAHVTVRSGHAIDCDGNDVVLDDDDRVDVMALVRALEEQDPDRPVLDQGDGEVCLTLETQPGVRGHTIGIERYDPTRDTVPGLLAGTLLMDFYTNCVKRIEDFLRDELTASDGDPGAGPAHQREAVLANLLAQIVNRQSGQNIYLSEREHDIVRGFYDRLRALLRSQTFCAMFADARPYPDYPESMPAGMDTIFGRGHHSRLRLRPGHREAYTVGGGVNPLRPTTHINRYDLERGVLVARIDPVAGAVDSRDVDTGTGAVQDVAFSPDGRRIYMVAPTRNQANTLFRAGQVTSAGINWGPLTTICGVRLVTLATTPADARHVYAIGFGSGLYRIDPDEVDPSMAPLAAFPAAGHLRITRDGRAVATAAEGDAPPRYDQLRGFRLADGTALFQTALGRAGMDDLALHDTPEASPTVYCVVGVDGAGTKQIEAYTLAGERLGVSLPTDDTAVRLDVYAPEDRPPLLLVTSGDGYVLRLVDADLNQPVAGYELPLQAGPLAVAADSDTGSAYALNYLTNTITVVPGEVLDPQFRFPFADLADYRSAALEAFADLAGGFLQYLKDCLCHHFLVDCPDCTGEETLYLACVSIRGDEVYNVCNFSGRRYVKSFPTIGYWLSLVPVIPFARRLVEWFCCMVLPEIFSRVTVPATEVPEPAPARPHGAKLQVATVQRNMDTVQATNLPRRANLARRDLGVGSSAVGRAMIDGLTAGPGRRGPGVADLFGQPGDRVEALLGTLGLGVRHTGYDPAGAPGVFETLMAVLRPPRPGEQVTLHEQDDRVRAVSVSPTEAADPRVEALSQSLQERQEEIRRLREQLEELDRRQAAAPAADRIAGMEAELRELRGLRDEVARLMRDRGRDRPDDR